MTTTWLKTQVQETHSSSSNRVCSFWIGLRDHELQSRRGHNKNCQLFLLPDGLAVNSQVCLDPISLYVPDEVLKPWLLFFILLLLNQ